MDKLYQVFISSTYEDLKKERSAAQQAVISSDCLPIGMENFEASDLDQLTFIKKLLDNVDYYILIIGGRYGSIEENSGLSYTELEYNYALEKEIPVLTFMKNTEKINSSQLDTGEFKYEKMEKLEKFKTKTGGKIRNYFSDCGELKHLISNSLNKAKKNLPRPGWIRTDNLTYEMFNKIEENNIEYKLSKLGELKFNKINDGNTIFKERFKIELKATALYEKDQKEIDSRVLNVTYEQLFLNLAMAAQSDKVLDIKEVNIIIDDLYRNKEPNDYIELRKKAEEVNNVELVINDNNPAIREYSLIGFQMIPTRDYIKKIDKFMVSGKLFDKKENIYYLTKKGLEIHNKITDNEAGD